MMIVLILASKIKLYLSEGYSDPCFKQVDVYYREKPSCFKILLLMIL